MTTELATGALPKDPKTGLTLPLSRSLGSQDLAKHSALVAVELEVMAKKMDRFGWERDRGTAAHDRLVTDWMDALRDYPLDEVKAACRRWVIEAPRKMPNEGDILAIIEKARREIMASHKVSDTRPATREEDEAIREEIARRREINPERAKQAQAILSTLGRKI